MIFLIMGFRVLRYRWLSLRFEVGDSFLRYRLKIFSYFPGIELSEHLILDVRDILGSEPSS